MPRKSKVNWKRMQKLLDHIKSLRQTKHRQFNMSQFIQFISGVSQSDKVVSIGRIRENGKQCGTACCLLGETIILFEKKNAKIKLDSGLYSMVRANYTQAAKSGRQLLGLTRDEAEHLYMGTWTTTPLEKITKKQAVKYLKKAIKARYIMVSIDDSPHIDCPAYSDNTYDYY